jgi:hypothetical protein
LRYEYFQSAVRSGLALVVALLLLLRILPPLIVKGGIKKWQPWMLGDPPNRKTPHRDEIVM